MRVLKHFVDRLTPLNEDGFLGFSSGRLRIPGTSYYFDPANTGYTNAAQSVGKTLARASAPAPAAPAPLGFPTWGTGTAGESTGQTGGYGGYGAGGDTTALKAAEDAQRAAALRPQIGSLIDQAKGVYQMLYGDVDVAAADKSSQIGKRYNQDEGALTSQFNDQFPLIGAGYAGRGTFDSSYRINKEKGATDAYTGSVEKLAQGRDDDLSEVGRYVAEQRAKFGAEEGGLEAIRRQIAESQNPDELTKVRNEIDTKVRELSASRAGLNSRAGYLGTLNSRVPEGQRIIGLQQSLGQVIASSVPAPIKRQVGTALLQQSGLSGQALVSALADFNAQIDEDEKQQQPTAVVPEAQAA